MPRIKAKVGSIVVLKTEKFASPMFSIPVPLGSLGEITKIYPDTVDYRDYPYDVNFGERQLPMKRGEFTTL